MYIIDSILKNVQGKYIKNFEQRIGEVFQSAFLNAQSDDQRKSLIKLINVWSLFLDS
jgi:CID domain